MKLIELKINKKNRKNENMDKNIFLSENELKELIPEWMKEVAYFKDKFRGFDPMHSALIIVDMQEEFLSCDGLLPIWGGPAILQPLSELINCFRECSRPVLYTKHLYIYPTIDGGSTADWWKIDSESHLLREGRWQTEIHKMIMPTSREYVILKHRYSGFFQTNLESLLRRFNVKDVVIGGVASNCCCEATAHDAFYRDFNIFFLADGTGGSDEKGHISVLRDIAWAYGTVLTCKDVINKMKGETL